MRSELYATGARPRTTAMGGVESLTERERRVATLAADGQTNRDIAQALYVTPKTGVDLGGREQLELERRDDAVVAAAAADRPEQVGLVVVVDARRAVEGGETRLGGGLRRSSPSAVTISTAVTAFA